MVTDFHDSSSSSSSFSSSSSSNSNSSSAETDDLPPPPSSPPSFSSSSSSSSRQPKRKAGRKKFRETRHPVYHGVRARNGGRWVSEMREPHKPTRIWLGTYPTPEMAARAHDVAAIALRGKSAPLNFSDSVHVLPRATSATPEYIRYAAARAAEMYRPSESSSSSLPLPQQQPPPPPPSPPPPVFVDEEAIFNMHGLIEDMAVGLLLTPPGMRRGEDWDGGECHVDWKLWSD